MYGHLALAVAALFPSNGPATRSLLPDPAAVSAALERPRVTVWLDRDQPYSSGEAARVYFKSEIDAYITIIRIDTDGRIRVLFPVEPWEDNFARGGRTFEVLGRSRDEAFRVDDAAGVGYVFGIASADPFSYQEITRGDHWDYRMIADGQVRGDPYVAVTDLAERIAPGSTYDYDVAEYYVDRHYDYPRFVCYDCHGYVSYHTWDPYSSFCSRFRIVIYDDPYYYPYRRYGGTHVVVTRPYRPGPRYVFKDFDTRNDYVTRVAQRPRDEDWRRGTDDRSSADIGGRGRVPAPVSPRARGTTPSDDRRDGGANAAPETRRPAPNDRSARDAAPEVTTRQPAPRDNPVNQDDAVDSPRRRVSPDPVKPSDPASVPARRSPDPQIRESPKPQPTQPPAREEPRKQPTRDRDKDAARTKPSQPKNTGEPELRRRKPS